MSAPKKPRKDPHKQYPDGRRLIIDVAQMQAKDDGRVYAYAGPGFYHPEHGKGTFALTYDYPGSEHKEYPTQLLANVSEAQQARYYLPLLESKTSGPNPSFRTKDLDKLQRIDDPENVLHNLGSLGEAIKAARGSMSQEDLADELGIEPSDIVLYEEGKVAVPDVSLLARMAHHLENRELPIYRLHPGIERKLVYYEEDGKRKIDCAKSLPHACTCCQTPPFLQGLRASIPDADEQAESLITKLKPEEWDQHIKPPTWRVGSCACRVIDCWCKRLSLATSRPMAHNDEQALQACETAWNEDVHEDIKKQHLDCRTGSKTLLHEAARNGFWRMAEWLIDKGADPNLQDSDGWTPLHVALRLQGYQFVDVLFGRCAKVGDAVVILEAVKDDPRRSYVGNTSGRVVERHQVSGQFELCYKVKFDDGQTFAFYCDDTQSKVELRRADLEHCPAKKSLNLFALDHGKPLSMLMEGMCLPLLRKLADADPSDEHLHKNCSARGYWEPIQLFYRWHYELRPEEFHEYMRVLMLPPDEAFKKLLSVPLQREAFLPLCFKKSRDIDKVAQMLRLRDERHDEILGYWSDIQLLYMYGFDKMPTEDFVNAIDRRRPRVKRIDAFKEIGEICPQPGSIRTVFENPAEIEKVRVALGVSEQAAAEVAPVPPLEVLALFEGQVA